MDAQEAYAARLDAQMRATDARLDELEAQARARNAKSEMDEISGLRARRDRVRQQVADARKELRGNSDALRRRVDTDWTDLRRSVADAHTRYLAWDAARERRFNAHMDEADGALRESAAKDAEVAADVRVELTQAQQELRDRVVAARQNYKAWRERQADEERRQKLDDAELELDEATIRYAAAREAAGQRGSGPTPS
jgi:hypothetical protein